MFSFTFRVFVTEKFASKLRKQKSNRANSSESHTITWFISLMKVSIYLFHIIIVIIVIISVTHVICRIDKNGLGLITHYEVYVRFDIRTMGLIISM